PRRPNRSRPPHRLRPPSPRRRQTQNHRNHPASPTRPVRYNRRPPQPRRNHHRHRTAEERPVTHAPWPLPKLRADHRTFHQPQLSTGDIHPTYPVLDHLPTQWGLNQEERTRLVFTHVAYYNLGSALSAWNTSEGDFTRMPTNLPTGTERRAHRDQTKLRRHLDHLDTIATTEGGLEPWITRALAPGSPTT